MDHATRDWAALGYPTNGQLRILARQVDRRQARVDRSPTGDGGIDSLGRFIGFVGERAFARAFRLDWQPQVLAHGTHRQNFELPGVGAVDVVTRRPRQGMRAPDLLLPVGPRRLADVLVLAVYRDWEDAELVGWIGAAPVRAFPVASFGRHGVRHHVVPARALAPIAELQRRVGVRPTQLGLLGVDVEPAEAVRGGWGAPDADRWTR